MNPVRAVCFDLDNTLWDVWPVILKAERAMYAYLVERYPKVTAVHTVESLREARNRTAALYPQMKHDFTFLRLQTLRDHAQEFGYEAAMAEEAFEVFIRARNEVELYPDVLPALDVLKERYRLFTASNGNADLAAIGLAPYFERTVAARHVGALKPDPVIFHKVIEGSDLALGEVVYVGDDPHLDVEGARNAGMQTIWVNRDGVQWPEGVDPPDWTASTLTDVVAILEGGGSTPTR